jgi:hypothetical protein
MGATVIISGTNFSTTASENTVFFGAVKATVTSSSATQLSVVVPAGATYAPVTVTTNRLTAYSSQYFNTTFASLNPQLSTASFGIAGNYGTGTYPMSVAIGDLNGDGKPELITGNAVGNSISIYKNSSSVANIAFENKIDLPVGADPKRIAIGDLDGDGRPDLTIVNFNGGRESTISIYQNNSTGGSISFGPKTELSTGNGSLGLEIADLNGDGKPDVVITSGNSGFFSILLNTTVGTTITFAPKQDFTLLSHPGPLVLADLDKDGRTDIVTSNFSDNNISVYRNISTSGFLSLASRLDFAVGTNPGDVSAGDLDSDGKLDLILRTSGQFSFLKNNSSPGSISLASPQGFPLSATNVEVGDLNGDGKPDISAGLTLVQANTGKVSIFENLTAGPGSLNLGTNVEFASGNYYTYVAIGDLDGDGRPEIAVANAIPYTLTIFRNRIDEPVVTQLLPAAARKGELVSIRGENFNGASAVKLGGTTPSSFTIVSSTRIDAVVDGGASGEVSVTTPKGTGSLFGFMFTPEVIATGATSFCYGEANLLRSTAAANNQWYKTGYLINGATGTTYQPTSSGNYTVKTTSNGITTYSPMGIEVNVIVVPAPTITFKDSLLISSATIGTHQWYFNGNLIPNATAQTYKPSEYGIYTVKLTDKGCTSAFSANFNYSVTGTIDFGNNQFIKLSPNPVRSVMVLQWNVANLQTLSVEIRDIYGKLAFFKRSVSSGETIHVAGLATGTYFVKMYGANRNVLGTTKILKIN